MCLIVSEVGGKEALAEPNREIGFGFVSSSCRAWRAGEAKLRDRVREMPSQRWGLGCVEVLRSGVGLVPALFAAMCMGFKQFLQ